MYHYHLDIIAQASCVCICMAVHIGYIHGVALYHLWLSGPVANDAYQLPGCKPCICLWYMILYLSADSSHDETLTQYNMFNKSQIIIIIRINVYVTLKCWCGSETVIIRGSFIIWISERINCFNSCVAKIKSIWFATYYISSLSDEQNMMLKQE